MANFHHQITDEIQQFIKNQHLFFVATSPPEGRINLSPKGIDTFRCLGTNEVAYLDLTGSGNETAAHLKRHNRITLMFCSFDKQPNIVRLYGSGEVIRPHNPRWETYFQHFTPMPGQRQIFSILVESVQTSCGFSIPYMEYKGERTTLSDWAQKKGSEGVQEYWRERNQRSIDGLPTGILDET